MDVNPLLLDHQNKDVLTADTEDLAKELTESLRSVVRRLTVRLVEQALDRVLLPEEDGDPSRAPCYLREDEPQTSYQASKKALKPAELVDGFDLR